MLYLVLIDHGLYLPVKVSKCSIFFQSRMLKKIKDDLSPIFYKFLSQFFPTCEQAFMYDIDDSQNTTKYLCFIALNPIAKITEKEARASKSNFFPWFFFQSFRSLFVPFFPFFFKSFPSYFFKPFVFFS